MTPLQPLVTDISSVSYIFVLLGGLGSGLSPCTLPTILLIVSYVGGTKVSRLRSFYISLSFVLGIAVTLSILGVAASLLGQLFLGNEIIWYVVAFIAIIMGLYLLDCLKFNLNIPVAVKPLKTKGVIGAFLLGLPFGLAASPCTMPVTATVLAYSAANANPVNGFFMMFIFAISRSIPLLLAGTFTGFVNNMKGMERWSSLIQKISGVILIIVGLYFLWTIGP